MKLILNTTVKMNGSEPNKTMNNRGTWPEQSDVSSDPCQSSDTHLLPEGNLDIGMSNIPVSGIMKADGSGDKKTLPNGQGSQHRKIPALQKSISAVLPAIIPLSRYDQYIYIF